VTPLEEKYQYNGIELNNDFGLMINEARYRTLDPQLGRWWQIDPEVEQFEAWSAYNSNLDNPISYTPTQKEIVPIAQVNLPLAVYLKQLFTMPNMLYLM
jgi:RHS repeat-associated protein